MQAQTKRSKSQQAAFPGAQVPDLCLSDDEITDWNLELQGRSPWQAA